MSYSSRIQAVPEFWRSANGLAALGSLGIHALALVVLPHLPLGSPELELPRTVGVVALTPEEQSRIPQALEQNIIPYPADQQGTLPLPPSQAFQSDILPPLPPPPSFLPPPPSSTPVYQFPLSESLPQPPSANLQVPLPPPPQSGQSFVSRYPFGQIPTPEKPLTVRLRQLAPLPPSAIPPKSNLPSTSNLKPSQPFFPTQNQLDSTVQSNSNQTQNQVATANQPAQIPSSIRSLPEKTKQELIARRNALSQQSANRITTPNSDRSQRLATLQQRLQQSRSSTPASPNSNRNQRLTTLQQRLQQPRASNLSPSQSDSDRTQRLATLQRQLQQQRTSNSSSPLSAATAQTIDQLEAFKARQQKVNQAFPQAVTKAPIRDRIKTCNKQLDGGVAVLATVVSPEGKIISGPDLLSKSGSATMRRDAMAYVRRYSFPKTDSPTNRQFRLQFQYDSGSCAVTSKEKL